MAGSGGCRRHAEARVDAGREDPGFNHLDHGDTFAVDETAEQADAGRYDGLVLPGGVANPDALRTDEATVTFIRSFFTSGKPVAVICHGPWTLIEADVVKGRRMTSWPSVKTDLRNAGAQWVDEEVVISDRRTERPHLEPQARRSAGLLLGVHRAFGLRRLSQASVTVGRAARQEDRHVVIGGVGRRQVVEQLIAPTFERIFSARAAV